MTDQRVTMRGSLVTEYPSCSTCKFLDHKPEVGAICRHSPPVGRYSEWPPIGYPDREWCGQHETKQGPAEHVDGPLDKFIEFVPNSELPTVSPEPPTPDPTPTDAPQVLPLSTPTRKRNR